MRLSIYMDTAGGHAMHVLTSMRSTGGTGHAARTAHEQPQAARTPTHHIRGAGEITRPARTDDAYA